LPQKAEYSEERVSWRHAKPFAKKDGLGAVRSCFLVEEMRDDGDVLRPVGTREGRRAGIMHNDRSRYLRHPLQHGEFEIPRVHPGTAAQVPEVLREMPAPLAVVEDKLLDVLFAGERAQQ